MSNNGANIHPFDRGDANSANRELAIVEFGTYIREGKLPQDLDTLVLAWEERYIENPTHTLITEREYYNTQIYHELNWSFEGALMAATAFALGEQFDIQHQESTGTPLDPDEFIAKIGALLYELKVGQDTNEETVLVNNQKGILTIFTKELLQVTSRYRLLVNNTNQPIDWQNYALLFGGELQQIKRKKKNKRSL